MGQYGHRFDSLIESKNRETQEQVLSEGKIINSIIKFCKDWKEFEVEEKKRREIVKKYKKQGMSDADAWKKVYADMSNQSKQAEEKKKKEKLDKLNALYTTEEKAKIKEIQEKIRKEFPVLKAKYFKADVVDNAHIDLKLDLFDFTSGATENDFVLGVVDMAGGYEIDYDGNEELFDQVDNISAGLIKKIKNIDTESDLLDGRGFYIYIDKKDL